MNDVYGIQISLEMAASKVRILESEKQQINESILYLDLNTSFSKIPFYTAMQIILRKTEGESSKIDQLSEDEIVKYYRSILQVLKSAMMPPDKLIVIEAEKLSYPITDSFLDFLNKEGFPQGNDLQEWRQFANKCENYFIPIVKVKKIILKINRYQNIHPQKSSTSTKVRQEFIIKVYSSLSKEDQALLHNKPQGRNGLKEKVRKKISDKDFTFYFANIDHNFDNSWKIARKALILLHRKKSED